LFFALLQRTDKEFRENRVSKFKLNEQFKRLTKDMVSKLPIGLQHYHHRLLMDTDSTIYLNPDPEGLYSGYCTEAFIYFGKRQREGIYSGSCAGYAPYIQS
jgi:hypothetical protein